MAFYGWQWWCRPTIFTYAVIVAPIFFFALYPKGGLYIVSANFMRVLHIFEISVGFFLLTCLLYSMIATKKPQTKFFALYIMSGPVFPE